MKRRGFGFPLILIAIGVVALLANFDLAPFSWTAALALWPLILVIVGVDLLLARRAPLAALAVDALVVALGLAILIALPPRPGGGFPFVIVSRNCADTPSDSISIPRDAAEKLMLSVSGGAGSFRVRGGSAALVEARSAAGDLTARTRRTGDRAVVNLTQCGTAVLGSRDVDVQIASDAQTSLAVTGGAGEFDLDLRDVKLTDVRLTNGASSTHLRLGKPNGDVSISVTGGASSVEIDLGGAEAHVDATGGLSSLNAPGASAGGVGRHIYETSGYASARDRYTITVTGGLSSVTVR